MTLLDYIEGLDDHFLVAGMTLWSVKELRVRLRAVGLGASADRRAFPEGERVSVMVDGGSPGTALPANVDTDAMVPSRVERAMRERIEAEERR